MQSVLNCFVVVGCLFGSWVFNKEAGKLQATLEDLKNCPLLNLTTDKLTVAGTPCPMMKRNMSNNSTGGGISSLQETTLTNPNHSSKAISSSGETSRTPSQADSIVAPPEKTEMKDQEMKIQNQVGAAPVLLKKPLEDEKVQETLGKKLTEEEKKVLAGTGKNLNLDGVATSQHSEAETKPATTQEGTKVPHSEAEVKPATTQEGTKVPHSEAEAKPATTQEGTKVPHSEAEVKPATTQEGTKVPHSEDEVKPATAQEGSSLPKPELNAKPIVE